MSNYTNSPDGRHDYLGVSPVSILGETPSADEGSPPGSALEADEFGGKLPRLKYGSKRMDAPETERFVCLLKEVLVKKGISLYHVSIVGLESIILRIVQVVGTYVKCIGFLTIQQKGIVVVVEPPVLTP